VLTPDIREMIIIESPLLQDERVSRGIETLRQDEPQQRIRVLKPEVIINLVEDGQSPDNFIFVISNFSGDLFHRLEQTRGSILGKSVFLECVETGRPLPNPRRPLYCEAFSELNLVFNSTTKTRLMELVNMVHWMGGQVRESIESRSLCDRLVAFNLRGPKFRKAVELDITIVNVDYVYHCWENYRDLSGFRASDKEFTQKYKRKTFEETRIYYFGYSAEQEKEFARYIYKGGGQIATNELDATHIMIHQDAEPSEQLLDIVSKYASCMTGPPASAWIVEDEWLWNSIQIDNRVGEKCFFPKRILANRKSQPDIGPEVTETGSQTSRTSNKRDRQQELVTSKSSNSNISLQSEISDEFNTDDDDLSSILSSRICLVTTRADLYSPKQITQTSRSRSFTEPSTKSQRISVAAELLNTEVNYVKILKILTNKYKTGLEDETQANGAILNSTESKLIFGNIPELLKIHESLLRDMQIVVDELTIGLNRSLGRCFLHYTEADNFGKAYSSYIQFMKQSKSEVDRMKEENDRFFAFLKVAEKENKDDQMFKQGFDSLLKAPMQRLLRYPMLLDRYKQEAIAENIGTQYIEEINRAVHGIKNISADSNEAKKTTDGYTDLYNIIQEIEDCPAILFNAKRKFIRKIKGLVVADNNLTKAGDKVVLFIFQDCVEVAKRKKRTLTSSSSKASLHQRNMFPTGGSSGNNNSNRGDYGNAVGSTVSGSYYLQHRELIYYSPGRDGKHMKFMENIYDIIETDKHQKCIALGSRSGCPGFSVAAPFQINNVLSLQLPPEIEKNNFLNELRDLIITERAKNGIRDENFDGGLIESIEGHRLKVQDTSLMRRGLFRTMSRKISFTRPGMPNFGEFDSQSLNRDGSQSSINSISSRISVKSAFTFTKPRPNLFRNKQRGMSFQADSRSMLNLPDIPKTVTKAFSKPFKKIINNFSKPNVPKEKKKRASDISSSSNQNMEENNSIEF
jgi:uncharacterized protein YfbU (UPF0304 family)